MVGGVEQRLTLRLLLKCDEPPSTCVSDCDEGPADTIPGGGGGGGGGAATGEAMGAVAGDPSGLINQTTGLDTSNLVRHVALCALLMPNYVSAVKPPPAVLAWRGSAWNQSWKVEDRITDAGGETGQRG